MLVSTNDSTVKSNVRKFDVPETDRDVANQITPMSTATLGHEVSMQEELLRSHVVQGSVLSELVQDEEIGDPHGGLLRVRPQVEVRFGNQLTH